MYLFYASLPCAEKLGEGVVYSSGKITWTHLPIMKILDADYGEPFRILVISEDQEESATLTIIPQPIIAKDNSNKKLEIEKTEVPYMWIYYLSGFEPNSTIFEKMRLDDEERSEMKEFDENGRMVGILMCNPKITGGSFHLQYIGGLMEKPLEATVYWGSKEEGNPPLLSPIGSVKIDPESTME